MTSNVSVSPAVQQFLLDWQYAFLADGRGAEFRVKLDRVYAALKHFAPYWGYPKKILASGEQLRRGHIRCVMVLYTCSANMGQVRVTHIKLTGNMLPTSSLPKECR